MPARLSSRFALEAAFLILVAAAAWFLKLSNVAIVIVMAIAWLLVATYEWYASRQSVERPATGETEPEFTEAPILAAATGITTLGERFGAGGRTGNGADEPKGEPDEAPAEEAVQPEPGPPLGGQGGRRRFWQRRPREEPLPLPPEGAAVEPTPLVQHVRVLPHGGEEREPVPTSAAEAAIPAEPGPIPETLLDEPDVRPLAEPTVPKQKEAEPEPEPEPEPEQEQEPEPAPPPLAALPSAEPEAPPPPPPPPPSPHPAVPVLPRGGPREWNLWELERRARERSGADVARDEEWSYLLMYLREFADPDGILPVDFDGLVRESFPELIGTM